MTGESTSRIPSEGDEALPDTPDEQAARAELDAARARLREVPAHLVVANHVMGLYELAAIHLSAEPPDLHSAQVAIDAVGLLVDGLGERLGPDHPTMAEALATLRLAFVQLRSLDS